MSSFNCVTKRYDLNTDWEQRKLGEVAEFNPKSILPDTFEYVDLESVVGIELISHRTETKDLAPSRAQRLAINGDIFFQTVRPYQKNNYLFQLPYNNYVFSTGYAQMRSTLDSYFLLSSLQEEYFVYKVLIRSTGTSYPAITSKNLAKINLKIPNKFEQVKIGNLFQKLDNTIALHQEKALTLRRAKKSFLQSLFPTAHKSVPQLRFTNFKDNWNQRELGEIFTERSDRSSMGELISVTINSGVIKSSELIRKDNSSSNKSNYKIVKKNDIAYNSMRMWQGASGYSVYDGILSPAYTVITPREGIDAELFSFLFKRNDMIQIFQKNSQGLTSDTWNLKFPTLSKIKINVPDNQEQLTIKKFLKHVDIMITLQQTKIDKLKKIKKAYLQKMFI